MEKPRPSAGAEEAREMAEAHWVWLESWLHFVYVDAFMHGFKHGRTFEQKLKNKQEAK